MRVICLVALILAAGCASKPAHPTRVNARTKEYPEQIRATLINHLPAYKACYETALERSPSLKGKVVLAWEIDEHGKARKVRIVEKSTTIKDQPFHQCMTDETSKLEFPAHFDSDEIVEIEAYPFFFTPDKFDPRIPPQ